MFLSDSVRSLRHLQGTLGDGRLHFTVEPGLYALGKPGKQSPVLVTANYKMSFDKLREALPGRDVWILVLDTQGSMSGVPRAREPLERAN